MSDAALSLTTPVKFAAAVQATMENSVASISQGNDAVATVVTTVFESQDVQIDPGSTPLGTKTERQAFSDSVRDATCEGMSGTCTVTLLSYRRRQLRARRLQPVTMSIDRRYDLDTSTNVSTAISDLIEVALAAKNVSVQSAKVTGLSVSTTVTVTGTDVTSSGITSLLNNDTISAALTERLPDVQLTVEATVIVTPPQPPPQPPSFPPLAPPQGAISNVSGVNASFDGVTVPGTMSTIWVIVALAIATAALIAAVVYCRARRRRLAGTFLNVVPGPTTKRRGNPGQVLPSAPRSPVDAPPLHKADAVRMRQEEMPAVKTESRAPQDPAEFDRWLQEWQRMANQEHYARNLFGMPAVRPLSGTRTRMPAPSPGLDRTGRATRVPAPTPSLSINESINERIERITPSGGSQRSKITRLVIGKDEPR